MNLWSHRFSQNNKKIIRISGLQYRRQKSFLFVSWEKRWLYKFILKFTDFYLWFNEMISKFSRLKIFKTKITRYRNCMIKIQSIFQKDFGPIMHIFFSSFCLEKTRRSPSSCNISDKANRDRARQKISLREYLKVLKSRQHYKSSRDSNFIKPICNSRAWKCKFLLVFCFVFIIRKR